MGKAARRSRAENQSDQGAGAFDAGVAGINGLIWRVRGTHRILVSLRITAGEIANKPDGKIW